MAPNLTIPLSKKRFRFCPICGAPYNKNQEASFHKHCDACGYTLFENLRVAAGAVIIQDNKMLFVRRAIDPGKGGLDIPGGFTEPTEHPEESIKREVFEELGVQVEIERLLGLFAPNFYDYLGKINFVCDAFYLVRTLTLDFTPQDDVASIEWYPLDRLPKPENLAFPTLRALIQNFRTYIPV